MASEKITLLINAQGNAEKVLERLIATIKDVNEALNKTVITSVKETEKLTKETKGLEQAENKTTTAVDRSSKALNRQAAAQKKSTAEGVKASKVIRSHHTLWSFVYGQLEKLPPILALINAAQIYKTFLDNFLDIQNATARLTAQMNLSVKETERFSAVGRDLYKKGFGESLNKIGDVIKEVHFALQGLSNVSEDSFKEVAKTVVQVKKLFGEDYKKTIDTVKVLMKEFGLTSKEAVDFIAAGFQQGLNATAAADFLETINEYSTQFSNAGATAGEFFSLIKSQLGSGVLGTDKAADAFKEFTLRILDGSAKTSAGLARVGLNSQKVTSDILSGNIRIIDVYADVIARLKEAGDQALYDQVSFALAGAPIEDLGRKTALALDITTQKVKDFNGAADNLSATHETLSAKATQAWRSIKIAIGESEIVESSAQGLEDLLDLVKETGSSFKELGLILESIVIQKLVEFGGILHSIFTLDASSFLDTISTVNSRYNKLLNDLGDQKEIADTNIILDTTKVGDDAKEVNSALNNAFALITSALTDQGNEVNLSYEFVRNVVKDNLQEFVRGIDTETSEVIKSAAEGEKFITDALVSIFDGVDENSSNLALDKTTAQIQASLASVVESIYVDKKKLATQLIDQKNQVKLSLQTAFDKLGIDKGVVIDGFVVDTKFQDVLGRFDVIRSKFEEPIPIKIGDVGRELIDNTISANLEDMVLALTAMGKKANTVDKIGLALESLGSFGDGASVQLESLKEELDFKREGLLLASVTDLISGFVGKLNELQSNTKIVSSVNDTLFDSGIKLKQVFVSLGASTDDMSNNILDLNGVLSTVKSPVASAGIALETLNQAVQKSTITYQNESSKLGVIFNKNAAIISETFDKERLVTEKQDALAKSSTDNRVAVEQRYQDAIGDIKGSGVDRQVLLNFRLQQIEIRQADALAALSEQNAAGLLGSEREYNTARSNIIRESVREKGVINAQNAAIDKRAADVAKRRSDDLITINKHESDETLKIKSEHAAKTVVGEEQLLFLNKKYKADQLRIDQQYFAALKSAQDVALSNIQTYANEVIASNRRLSDLTKSEDQALYDIKLSNLDGQAKLDFQFNQLRVQQSKITAAKLADDTELVTALYQEQISTAKALAVDQSQTDANRSQAAIVLRDTFSALRLAEQSANKDAVNALAAQKTEYDIITQDLKEIGDRIVDVAKARIVEISVQLKDSSLVSLNQTIADSFANTEFKLGFVIDPEAIQRIRDTIKQLKDSAQGVLGVGTTAPVQGFAGGGFVRGAGTGTSDSILAALSNGEYVLKSSAVDSLGVGFLNLLNQGGVGRAYDSLNGLKIPAFANGGFVNFPSGFNNNVNGGGGGGDTVNINLNDGNRQVSLTARRDQQEMFLDMLRDSNRIN